MIQCPGVNIPYSYMVTSKGDGVGTIVGGCGGLGVQGLNVNCIVLYGEKVLGSESLVLVSGNITMKYFLRKKDARIFLASVTDKLTENKLNISLGFPSLSTLEVSPFFHYRN